MVLTLKRTEAVTQQEEDAEALRKEQDRVLAKQQRDDLRSAAVESLHKLGKGISMWEREGWGWNPSKDAAPSDPEEWAGLARMLYRMCQVSSLVRELDWLAISPGRPYWCPGCSGPQENRPSDYYVGECPEHTGAPAQAINLGESLFGGKR